MKWTMLKPVVPGMYLWRDDENTIRTVLVTRLNESSPLFVDKYGWLDDMPNGHWSVRCEHDPL